MTKQQKTSAIILAGLAVFGIYKYSKLSSEDKSMILDKIKTSGKDLLSQVNTGPLKNILTGKGFNEPSHV